MKDITNNEMLFVLCILKSPGNVYNTSNIAKIIGISPMGALKIARRLEKENIIKSKEIGKARIYKLNFQNDYVKHYIKFLLKRESEQAPAYIKMWVNELRKIKNADAAILFGSILRAKKANDIDVLLVTSQERFSKLKQEIEKINIINIKKIHPMYQCEMDIKKNIDDSDKALLNAIKGLVIFGEDKIIDLLEK